MDRSPGFGSTDTDETPYSDSLSLRLRLNTLTTPVPRNSQVHSSIGTRSALLAHGPFTVCKHTVSCSISLPFGGSFHLSLTVLVHYRSLTEYLALEDGPPSFRQGFSCPALLRNSPTKSERFRLRDYHRSLVRLSSRLRLSIGFFTLPAIFSSRMAAVQPRCTQRLERLHVYGLGCSRFARHYYGNLG